MNEQLISFIRDYSRTEEFIPIYASVFNGKEKSYVVNTIDSTFVSSVGAYVERFEINLVSYMVGRAGGKYIQQRRYET